MYCFFFFILKNQNINTNNKRLYTKDVDKYLKNKC